MDSNKTKERKDTFKQIVEERRSIRNYDVNAKISREEIEEMLEEYSFIRVHHSYIVNLNEVSKYIKGEGGYLIMSDDSTVDVSRSRKEMLLKKLQPGRY